MKTCIVAAFASAVILLADDQPKEDFRVQAIAAPALEQFQKLQSAFAVLEYKLCNDAGLLRQDCIVNWQAGLILKKPAPKPPVEPPAKEPEK